MICNSVLCWITSSFTNKGQLMTSSAILISALVVMLTSLSGVLFIFKTTSSLLEQSIDKLVSTAAGVFLVTALVLGQEVFHLLPSIWSAGGLIILGYSLAWLVHQLIPESHHLHNSSCTKSAKKLVIGDAVHNIGDGIVLVAAYTTSMDLGLAVTISIIVHESIQETAKFFVLRKAGYSTKQALAMNLVVSSTILIGVTIGLLALKINNLEGILLGVTSGFFLHVVFNDLLPIKKSPDKPPYLRTHLSLVLIGAILMSSVVGATRKNHIHGHQPDHGHINFQFRHRPK